MKGVFPYIISTQLPTLPSGKIINWNNNLYYGNQQQIANNTQITSLQSQINNLLGGNKLIFLQKNLMMLMSL